MRVSVTKTSYEKVELSDAEAMRVALRLIYKASKFQYFDSRYYISKEGFLCWEEECHTSHSFEIEHKIREATEEDKFTVDLISKLWKL